MCTGRASRANRVINALDFKQGTARVAEAVLDIVLGTTNGPIFFGFFSLVLSAAKITF